MRHFALALLVIIALMALILGIAVVQPAPENESVPLSINATPGRYTLIMSSAPGIGLMPVYPAMVDNRTVSFRWQTNYGRFLSWNAPDFKINEQGRDLTTGEGKIYWSYLDEDSKNARPPVHITLAMIDKATGSVLGTAGLEIGWESGDVAVVKA